MAIDNERQMLVIFGNIIAGTDYQDRPAAYAVITNEMGSVAAVKGKRGYFLPGGGAAPNETPQETIHRELREELARDVKLIGEIGAAIQYFSADETNYRMRAVFYRAEFITEPNAEAEHELFWLAPQEIEGKFFHQCHEWAIGIRDTVDPERH